MSNLMQEMMYLLTVQFVDHIAYFNRAINYKLIYYLSKMRDYYVLEG